ncbi:MAG: ATP-binding protein [Candidatus Electrothrix sp. ATG1]|nr:ATP-binding protein [Candidatus Electrothrix sp. ATG1]
MVNQELTSRIRANAETLEAELAWLQSIIEARLDTENIDEVVSDISRFPPPSLDSDHSMYANFVHHYDMSPAERLTVLLALTPHVRPQLLDIFFQVNSILNRGYTEFGGVQGKAHGGFLPTGETALYLLAADDLHMRFECQQLFDRDHFFARHNILKLEPVGKGEPMISGQLDLADEIIDFLTTGELRKPDFSRDFPARLLSTEMEWGDLVLSWETQEQLKELQAWIDHEQILMNDWGLGKRLRPGYKCLFYGPSGTGKTVTATVLGKKVGKDVYRIDLSSVVSKYIGETEKNLERIFDRAENMNCILFFDEADALFSKRTNISSSHDRYANQEVSYLLQRIEDFAGIVILASNFKGNFDEAFSRRFQAVVHFPIPNSEERYRLWREVLPEHIDVDKDASLKDIADEYKLSGGAILNVVRYALLMTLHEGTSSVPRKELINGIRRELQKEGKTL